MVKYVWQGEYKREVRFIISVRYRSRMNRTGNAAGKGADILSIEYSVFVKIDTFYNRF